MQRSDFRTGGFVLHKVRVGNSLYSAWFDAAGKLLDCERSGGGAVPARCVRVRAELQRVGLREQLRK
jgi:hypothetical protein